MSTEPTTTINSSAPFKWHAAFLAYGVVMFLILVFGFFGNLFTVIVLRQREHRKKSITPLMMNLAIADMSIVVFGYPAVISSNLSGETMKQGSSMCIWSGFVNSVTGMTSIATLTAMSIVVYQTIKRNTPHFTASRRQSISLVAGTWVYGFAIMIPPLVGWNRFVPGRAGFSCAPDWAALDSTSLSYTVFLMVLGFFVPLILLGLFHYLIFRELKHRPLVTGNAFVQARRIKYQKKLVYMTSAIIFTFLLSWSPYCFVSLAAMVKGGHVLSSGEAEIPELMAKASVIYNPLVYTFMNDGFRNTLWGIVSGNREIIAANDTRNVTENAHTATQREQSIV